jgi:hypothetical protein
MLLKRLEMTVSKENLCIRWNNKNQNSNPKMAAAGRTDKPARSFLDYALAGERLARRGEREKAVKYFLKALSVGTDDQRALCALHSQVPSQNRVTLCGARIWALKGLEIQCL